MDEIRFSIIFPTYGVEAYIREAINDIRHQTYDKWELIIVDDASPDKSGAIADEFASTDGRISVIHKKENEGVSAARNTGMEKATGEYLLFLDPDDRFEEELLSSVADEIEAFSTETGHRPEVVGYGLSEDYYRGDEIFYTVIHNLPDGRYTSPAQIYPILVEMEKETLYGYPWDKAFSAGLLREYDITYEKIMHVEDILFNISVFNHVRYFSNLSRPLVHYRNQEKKESRRLTGQDIPEYFKLQKTRLRRLLAQYSLHKSELDSTQRRYILRVFAAEYARSFLSMIEREVAAGTPQKVILAACEEERNTVYFRKLMPLFATDSKMLKIMYAPLKKGHFRTAIMEAGVISAAKNAAPGVYDRLKQKR